MYLPTRMLWEAPAAATSFRPKGSSSQGPWFRSDLSPPMLIVRYTPTLYITFGQWTLAGITPREGACTLIGGLSDDIGGSDSHHGRKPRTTYPTLHSAWPASEPDLRSLTY